jgi:type I restriction enzyme S subunit
MNRIEKLIAELCPDGVEWKKLGEVAEISTGGSAPQGIEYFGGNNPFVRVQHISNEYYRVINCDYITDKAIKKYRLKLFPKDTIIFPKSGASIYLEKRAKLPYDAYIVSHLMAVISKSPLLSQDYLFIYLTNKKLSKDKADSYPTLNISEVSELHIPIPPLPIQEEIVKILDTFTELKAELEAELEARRKQYEYYRNTLLTPVEHNGRWYLNGVEVEWKKLGEVCVSIIAGGDLPKNYIKSQKYPTEEYPYPIYSNGVGVNALYGFSDSYIIDLEAVTISARGTIGYHTIRQPKFTPIVRLITLIPKKQIITTKFLNYILDITEIGHSGGSIPQLTVPDVKKIPIPIPPLSEQERIVAILDKFDALVNDISQGLPAELEARRKQYEYYRNRLLNFSNR